MATTTSPSVQKQIVEILGLSTRFNMDQSLPGDVLHQIRLSAVLVMSNQS